MKIVPFFGEFGGVHMYVNDDTPQPLEKFPPPAPLEEAGEGLTQK